MAKELDYIEFDKCENNLDYLEDLINDMRQQEAERLTRWHYVLGEAYLTGNWESVAHIIAEIGKIRLDIGGQK